MQKILLPASARSMDVNALMAHICVDSPNIMFYMQELLPPNVQKQADPLMIIVNINIIIIKHTLVETNSALNICGIDLLLKIKIGSSSLIASSLYICGFDNIDQKSLGTIIMPLWLDRPWIHAMGAMTYTLHHSLKFVENNRVVTIKADPEAIHLCELVATS